LTTSTELLFSLSSVIHSNCQVHFCCPKCKNFSTWNNLLYSMTCRHNSMYNLRCVDQYTFLSFCLSDVICLSACLICPSSLQNLGCLGLFAVV
jgi:hypothetical protein